VFAFEVVFMYSSCWVLSGTVLRTHKR
jgi:hypothetical protein